MAGMVDTLGVWVILSIAYPVLQIGLGLSPIAVGLALMVFRLWDAFSDPLMGWISDHARTRWGRRRPFIFAGALLSALTFPLLWWFDPAWGEREVILWFTGFGILFYSCFTVWSVPYASLMLELSGDYDERTRLFSYRTIFQMLATVFLGSVWWLIHRVAALNWMPETEQVLTGIRVVSIGLAVPIFLLGVAPALFLKEPRYVAGAKATKAHLWEGIGRAWNNRDAITVFLMHALFLLGGGIGSGLSYYLTTYYLFDGSTERAAGYQSYGTLIFCGSNLLGVWFFDRFSKRLDKPVAIRGAMAMLVLASLSSWFLYQPAMPALHLAASVLVGFGNAGFFLLGASILADLVDADALENGTRIEGSFAALLAWSMKCSISLAFAISGWLVAVSGFDPAGLAQGDTALQWLRVLFIGMPALCVGTGLLMSLRLKTSRERAHQVRAGLEGMPIGKA
jgi:glycoside/pentoside/hexuronide:cation symporter, GPH family